jgi:hypothetical protein
MIFTVYSLVSFNAILPHSSWALRYQPFLIVPCRRLHSIIEMQMPVLCSFFPSWSIPRGLERLVVMWNDWIKWKLNIFHLSQEKLPFELRDRLLSTVLRPKGQVLISTLITASIFSLSTCSLPNVADVLLEFMLVDRQVSSNSFCLNLFTFADHFFISWCRAFQVGWSKH